MGKTVLIVDDCSSQRREVRDVLESGGYEVIEACGGLDGLAELDRNTDIDAMLVDLNMPHMPGREIMHSMRERGDFERIPVVVITSGDRTMVSQARRYGAKGCLTKPVERSSLLEQVAEATDE